MSLEVVGCYRNSDKIKEQCKCHLYYHAVIMMTDGTMVDGIIESVNEDSISVLVGEDVIENIDDKSMNRQPPGGFNGRNRYRRFGPRRYPIGGIGGVGLLPYPIIPPFLPPYPYPYPYPYYPV